MGQNSSKYMSKWLRFIVLKVYLSNADFFPPRNQGSLIISPWILESFRHGFEP